MFLWDELSAADVLATLLRGQEQGEALVSAFLDAHQWIPLQGRPGIALAGGHALAQFRRATLDAEPQVRLWSLDLSALTPTQRSARALRRLLLQGAGEIPAVGDLVVDNMQAFFATTEHWQAPELSTTCQPIERWPELTSAPQSASIASLRLDAVLATTFRLSRSEASAAIENGYVFLNWVVSTKPSRHVAVGDQLVLRGKGRAELVSAALNERSGRSRISFRAFPA